VHPYIDPVYWFSRLAILTHDAYGVGPIEWGMLRRRVVPLGYKNARDIFTGALGMDEIIICAVGS